MIFNIFRTNLLDFLFSKENTEIKEKDLIKEEFINGCFIDPEIINWISNDLWENFRKNEDFENALKMITFDFQENTEALKRFWMKTVAILIYNKEINYQIEPYVMNLVNSTWEIVNIFSECYFLKKNEQNADLQDIFDDLSDSLEVQNGKNVIPYIPKEKKNLFCSLLLTYKDGRGTVPWKELKEEKEDDDELLKDHDATQENNSIMSNTIALAFNATINPYLFSFFTLEYVFNYPVINLIKESLKYISRKLSKTSNLIESDKNTENEANLEKNNDEDKEKINYIKETEKIHRIKKALQENEKLSESNKKSSENNKTGRITYQTDFDCSKEFSIENSRNFYKKTKSCKHWKKNGLFLERRYFAQDLDFL